jgi:hypothetical protein
MTPRTSMTILRFGRNRANENHHQRQLFLIVSKKNVDADQLIDVLNQ